MRGSAFLRFLCRTSFNPNIMCFFPARRRTCISAWSYISNCLLPPNIYKTIFHIWETWTREASQRGC
ncbi:unnamed protein product [Leptidea sinapis]|uniref:Uncharacterized protein n=1 Tax=Leptidea sinapis TaxID=189913 RepID=A0A5E4R117_9NEOP|nr:unnamed protein product [Leptidea sinapis]